MSLMRAYSLDLRRRVVRAYEQGRDSIAQPAISYGKGSAYLTETRRGRAGLTGAGDSFGLRTYDRE
jgi:hypothetical protein